MVSYESLDLEIILPWTLSSAYLFSVRRGISNSSSERCYIYSSIQMVLALPDHAFCQRQRHLDDGIHVAILVAAVPDALMIIPLTLTLNRMGIGNSIQQLLLLQLQYTDAAGVARSGVLPTPGTSRHWNSRGNSCCLLFLMPQ